MILNHLYSINFIRVKEDIGKRNEHDLHRLIPKIETTNQQVG